MRDTALQKTEERRALRLPFLAALAGAVILIAAFFLPFSSATKEYRERLETYAEYADELFLPELKMTYAESTDLSVFQFARIYKVIYETESKTLGTEVLIVIAAIVVFTLLTLLVLFLKRPIGVLFFDLLTAASVWMLIWEFRTIGTMPGDRYGYGISCYIFFIGAAVVLCGAVWMFVVKRKRKQDKKYGKEELQNE